MPTTVSRKVSSSPPPEIRRHNGKQLALPVDAGNDQQHQGEIHQPAADHCTAQGEPAEPSQHVRHQQHPGHGRPMGSGSSSVRNCGQDQGDQQDGGSLDDSVARPHSPGKACDCGQQVEAKPYPPDLTCRILSDHQQAEIDFDDLPLGSLEDPQQCAAHGGVNETQREQGEQRIEPVAEKIGAQPADHRAAFAGW